MTVYTEELTISTKGEVEFFDLTDKIREAVERSGVMRGLVHVFTLHTTGIITITEHEPNLLNDIRSLLERLAPKGTVYSHPDNAHSHLRSLLLSPEKTIPLVDGKLMLGTWQSSSSERWMLGEGMGEW